MIFERYDISEYLNREILDILTPMQLKFFSDYQEGIRSMEQLRLEYEQKRLIRAIVDKKSKEKQ